MASQKGDFELTVGSGEECEYRLDKEDINPLHATLRRRGDRLFLRDEGSVRGTFINSRRLPAHRWKEITRYDVLRLSRHLIELPNLFQGRSRMGLDTAALQFTRNGRILCKGVFIRAKAGTLTAIMGPSGSGKSVFLKMLNGHYQPDEGEIQFGEEPLSRSERERLIREFTGYVPQAEILLPELTVQESLDYRLRLKFPDMEGSVRQTLIEKVCQNLGFQGDRLQTFLRTRIGSADSTGHVLSGGERRRASIAHELILQPLVLFLDEPTTGLSSTDADELVALLGDLAKSQGVTIIMTVHQPSRESFLRFDSLLLIGLGGHCLYHGPAHQALAFFGINPKGLKSPGDLLIKETARIDENKILPDQTQFPFQPLPSKDIEEHANRESAFSWSPGNAFLTVGHFLAQLWILFCRGIHVISHDRANLYFTIAQVPLIAVLILLGFRGAEINHRGSDTIVSSVRKYDELKTHVAEHPEYPIRNDAALLREAVRMAETNPEWMSEPQARQKATVYFVLTLCAIWFGLLGSCKEIVTEQEVIRRETRTGVKLGALFLAKFSQQGLVIGLQLAGLLLLLLPFTLLLVDMPTLLRLWWNLLLGGLAASGMGLLVSASLGTYRAVMTIIPLLMIPQVLFGGILRPLDIDSPARFLSWPTVSRWTFEFALSADPNARQSVLQLLPPTLPDDSVIGAYSLLQNLIRTEETGILPLIFTHPVPTSQIILILHAMIVAFLSLAIFVLTMRFRSK